MAGEHARYLINPETGRAELVVASEVAAKQSVSWVDPQGLRGNGMPYNGPDDQAVTDAAGAMLEASRNVKAAPPAPAKETLLERVEDVFKRVEDDIKSL